MASGVSDDDLRTLCYSVYKYVVDDLDSLVVIPGEEKSEADWHMLTKFFAEEPPMSKERFVPSCSVGTRSIPLIGKLLEDSPVKHCTIPRRLQFLVEKNIITALVEPAMASLQAPSYPLLFVALAVLSRTDLTRTLPPLATVVERFAALVRVVVTDASVREGFTIRTLLATFIANAARCRSDPTASALLTRLVTPRAVGFLASTEDPDLLLVKQYLQSRGIEPTRATAADVVTQGLILPMCRCRDRTDPAARRCARATLEMLVDLTQAPSTAVTLVWFMAFAQLAGTDLLPFIAQTADPVSTQILGWIALNIRHYLRQAADAGYRGPIPNILSGIRVRPLSDFPDLGVLLMYFSGQLFVPGLAAGSLTPTEHVARVLGLYCVDTGIGVLQDFIRAGDFGKVDVSADGSVTITSTGDQVPEFVVLADVEGSALTRFDLCRVTGRVVPKSKGTLTLTLAMPPHTPAGRYVVHVPHGAIAASLGIVGALQNMLANRPEFDSHLAAIYTGATANPASLQYDSVPGALDLAGIAHTAPEAAMAWASLPLACPHGVHLDVGRGTPTMALDTGADPVDVPCGGEADVWPYTSQLAAVMSAVASPLTLLEGPPGTGKTATAAMMVRCLFRTLNNGATFPDGLNEALAPVDTYRKVLLLAHSNSALDQLCQHSHALGVPVLRLGASTDCTELTLDAAADRLGQRLKAKYSKSLDSLLQDRRRLHSAIIAASPVVAVTISALPRRLPALRPGPARLGAAVLEEAGRVMDPELTPLLPAVTRLAMVGDSKQLAPLVLDSGLRDRNLDLAPFERLARTGVHVIRADRQGRACGPLADVFRGAYERLEDLPCCPKQSALLSYPLSFVDIRSGGQREVSSSEVYAVGQLWGRLRELGLSPGMVAVITPYNKQKAALLESKDLADTVKAGLLVATVDEMQGLQRDHVILTMAAARLTDFIRASTRRVVAVSRARQSLTIVCDTEVLRGDAGWAAVLSRARPLSLRSEAGYEEFRATEGLEEVERQLAGVSVWEDVGKNWRQRKGKKG
ncbi:AAA domain [Carpediemonas membranifera]|uniref:AAA domain n=1 Tax=Carpediemonas membranifera TaxID=201153 RepID=A0A8J6DXI9_9EUKA|nr:AAA domain [Carpediemonas membranifera]|eukprot:KAG9390234.1 AAA domain [Carpediemonas membranifera]